VVLFASPLDEYCELLTVWLTSGEEKLLWSSSFTF